MRLIAVFFCLFAFVAAPLWAAAPPVDGKVSIINFSDDHCMPCKMMGRMVSKMQDEYKGEVVAVTINALEEREVAAKYSAKTLPTLIFFNRQGEEVGRHVGIMDESAMRGMIDSLLAE